MDLTFNKMKKIKIRRGDALGGTVPLSLIQKAEKLTVMREEGKGVWGRKRRRKKGGMRSQLYILLAIAIVAGVVAALLTEGPKL